MSKPSSGLFPNNVKTNVSKATPKKSKLKKQNEMKTIDTNIANADMSPNKLHHIFDKTMHNIDDFLESFNGDEVSALKAIHFELIKVLHLNELNEGEEFQQKIIIKNIEITVRGKIVDNKIRISTAFKKDKGDKNK